MFLRRFARPFRRVPQTLRIIRQSGIVLTPAAFATIYARVSKFDALVSDEAWKSAQQSSVAANTHPNGVVASERYDRVAAESGLEIRDPFTDIELLTFCVSLPDSQRTKRGARKAILRHSMRNWLPRAVCDRTSKEHLGHLFTDVTFGQLRRVNISLTTHVFGSLIRLPHCDMESLAPAAGEYHGYWLGLERWLLRVNGTHAAI